MEAATSRLEDITIYKEQAIASASQASDPSTASSTVSSASAPAPSAPPASAPAPPAPAEEPAPEESPLVSAFSSLIDKHVTPFVKTSSKIEAGVEEVVKILASGFEEEKNFLELVSIARPTPVLELPPYIAPIQKLIQQVGEKKEAYRGKFRNHVNAIEAVAPILGWVVLEGASLKPLVDYIQSIAESAKFWSDRVLKEFRGVDETSVEWVTQLEGLSKALVEYIKQHHQGGVAWKIGGAPIKEASEKLKTLDNKATSGGAPPPPPPPPPPASVFEVKESSDEQPKGMSAVFLDLNKGVGITLSLKKVDKLQMTHKNPELRNKPPPRPKKPVLLGGEKKPEPKKKRIPPKKELLDSKWNVLNFENDHTITIDGEMNHSVFIAKCTNCTITIKGKVNAVSVSECEKVGILTDALISGLDVIKTHKFQVQPLAAVPMISVDQSSDGEIYLGKASIDTEIFSSGTTALNIYTADLKDDDGDFKEYAVPEQFRHRFDKEKGCVVSEIVEASG